MPTNHGGWHSEYYEPKYMANPVVVRKDHFDHLPFICEQPRVSLPAGTYVAEWEVELERGDIYYNEETRAAMRKQKKAKEHWRMVERAALPEDRRTCFVKR